MVKCLPWISRSTRPCLTGNSGRTSMIRHYLSTLVSGSNFRESVILCKEEARKLLLIENIVRHHQPADVNERIRSVTKQYLCDQLNTDIETFWSWSYQRRNFFLLKFSSMAQVTQLQDQCGYNVHSFPVRTRMLEASWKLPLNTSEQTNRTEPHYELTSSQSKQQLQLDEFRRKFTSAQLAEYLAQLNSLTELDLQLRYFIIIQLEELLCAGIMSGFNIHPFGSSLAGLGDSTSDLDIALLHNDSRSFKNVNFSMPEVKSERDLTQQSLSLVADKLRHFVPNFCQINRILRARVPIVKMTFEAAPVDIDISIELSEESGHHGFVMANYIAYCVEAHPLVKQFFVFLKNWAKQHALVKSIAGNWFTNFQIITLAIYFLQSKNIVHSIENYEKTKQLSLAENTNDQQQELTLVKLLYEFFEFLISFNFDKEAISILEARTFTKPDFSPMYIENPIERQLNICKNVSGVEFKKLLLVGYNSLDAMHNEQFHLADLLDAEYFKRLEVQTTQSDTRQN